MAIEHLDTLDDPRLDAFVRLTDVQLRSRLEPEKGIFIAESDKVIARALEGGMEPLSLLMEPKWLDLMQPIIDAIARQFPAVPVFVVPQNELSTITGYELTRGALAAFRRPQLPSVADVCAGARRIVVLEDITNHTNVGAIFRSAAGLGMDGALVTPACYDPLYRRAVRVSMGAVFQIPWTRIGSTKQWSEEGTALLHELGFKTAALALCEDALALDSPRLAAEERLALVLGTEGDGLAQSTIAHCDYTVRIPMHHGVDSLNVAAASAVAFWQLRTMSGTSPLGKQSAKTNTPIAARTANHYVKLRSANCQYRQC